MSKVNHYRQCILIKKIPTGEVKTNCYIDAKYATVGRVVGMQKKDESWDEGWTVTAAGELTEARFIENQAHNSHKIWEPSTALTNRGNK